MAEVATSNMSYQRLSLDRLSLSLSLPLLFQTVGLSVVQRSLSHEAAAAIVTT